MNEVKQIGEVCRLADSFQDDYQKLHQLWDEAKENRVYYSDSDFGFICEHIRNYAEKLIAERKVNKLLDDY